MHGSAFSEMLCNMALADAPVSQLLATETTGPETRLSVGHALPSRGNLVCQFRLRMEVPKMLSQVLLAIEHSFILFASLTVRDPVRSWTRAIDDIFAESAHRCFHLWINSI